MSDLRSGVRYDPIVVSAESTVVAEHFSESSDEAAYQSEAALERGFISVLQSQAYEYVVPFGLPSTAAAAALSRSSNGRLEWKTTDGGAYGDWENCGVE